MRAALFLLPLIAATAYAQQAGTNTPESPLPFSIQECSASGTCTNEAVTITLDSNWRWTHHVNDYVNCYTGNQWDPVFCPDVDTCTANCALDGVAAGDWSGTYGVSATGSELTIKFVTNGPYSKNIGSRNYLLKGQQYKMFYLLNKEISFDVDDSQLDCGLNGALYLIEMQADGGLSEFPTNKCGAKYGTGYCDAQCPHDMKWISGEANIGEWYGQPDDPNSGHGHYGACCPEMDLWEANKQSQAYTSHPCDVDGYYRCEQEECGDNETDDRYNGLCDKDGCDFASYRHGDKNFWGPGASYTVDSTKKVQVITQFLTNDGTDTGDLVEIRRVYVQDGQVIENSKVNIPGVEAYDSITDDFCVETKLAFGDRDDHAHHGGLVQMGKSLARGHTLALSLWDDHAAYMLWLDSNYPVDADPSQPGIARGPCPTTSGRPEEVEAQQPNAAVKFSNIKYGPIGSTYAKRA
jgi:cellulose 1,4-beta-cellobiosidase